MTLEAVMERLAAPLPTKLVSWKPQMVTKDKKRALMVAYIDARAVMDRLDAVTPGQWHFSVEVIPGTPTPTCKGSLTVMGVTREDIGEAGEGDAGTLKAAASDALKRCAVHFGVGRYLYDLPVVWADWDDQKRSAMRDPVLPVWARPAAERTAGGAHLVNALEELTLSLPEDVTQQREIYKHLRAALATLNAPPVNASTSSQEGAGSPANASQVSQEPQNDPEALQRESTSEQRQALAVYARRAGAGTSEQRAALWGHLMNGPAIGTTQLDFHESKVLLEWLASKSDQELKQLNAQAQGKLLAR